MDVGVAPRFEARKVVRDGPEFEAVAPSLLDLLGDARGAPHDLLRDAPDVDARAAEALRFHERDGLTVPGRAARRGDAAAPAAEYQVVEPVRHPALPSISNAAGAFTKRLCYRARRLPSAAFLGSLVPA